MTRDGEYTAWFRTPRRQGTGVLRLVGGKITGDDGRFSFRGNYEIADDRLTAVLIAQREADCPLPHLDPDRFEIGISGVFKGGMIWCSGAAEQLPELRIEAILFPRTEIPHAASAAGHSAAPFDRARLSKLPGTGQRSRHPLANR